VGIKYSINNLLSTSQKVAFDLYPIGTQQPFEQELSSNWLYAQLHYFLNFSLFLVSCLPLLDKLINSGVPDLSSHGNNNQTLLN